MKTNQAAMLTNPLLTPEHLARKAIIYLRQSSVEQVQRNTGSQAFQRSQKELARLYGWPEDLIEIIDEDLGKSGSTVDRRSGWKRMLNEIAANRVGAVFAANISRLGRQILPIEELRLLAAYHGTLLWLDNRFSDPNDPNDTILTHITASFAQYENKKRTEHMTKARMAKAKNGAVVSLLPVSWIKTADGKYDYDPAIAHQFNNQGIKSASGKPWTDQMVYGLVQRYFKKLAPLEEEHRKAIADARTRGLDYEQMAIEFNERKIRRRDGQPWRPKDIKKRWADLNRLQRKREQKESMRAQLSETVLQQETA